MMSPPTYYLTYTSSLTWSAVLKPSTFTQIYQSARDNNQKQASWGLSYLKMVAFCILWKVVKCI